jgi:uncharacterized protein involved in exopolysaccharide biosynthesis
MSADKLSVDKKPRRSLLARLFGPLPPVLTSARFAFGVALLAIALSFLISNRYSATATFYLDSRSPTPIGSAGDLASIASQVGLTAAGGGVSPYLVSELATSDTVLTDVARLPLPKSVFLRMKPSPTLEAHYDMDDKSAEKRFRRTVTQLRERVGTGVGNRSGIVTLSVWDHDPGVAAWLADQVLERTQHYLAIARSSRARAERRFVESRERSVRDSLDAAESQLTAFLSNNRMTTQSPLLQMREQQYRRNVEILLTLYTSVQRDVERARAEEVRDTPVMTVTATPFPPVKKTWPKRSIIAAIAFVLAFGLHLTRRQWVPAVRAMGAGLERPLDV